MDPTRPDELSKGTINCSSRQEEKRRAESLSTFGELLDRAQAEYDQIVKNTP
jgi:hypothetical protein